MNKDQKFKIFLEIAETLSRHGITPTLYGSLGLYRLIPQIDEIDDIDIIIPTAYLENKFEELKNIMAEIGYAQDKTFPHEFIRGEGQIGFEPEDELVGYAGVDYEKFNLVDTDGVKFKELRPQDYLAVYKKTLEVREGQAQRYKTKIESLEKFLRNI